jgi:hypothetical protein
MSLRICTTAVIVSYFNVFQINWCVVFPEDGDVITETCRSDRNCTAMCIVCAYVGFENETCNAVLFTESG